MSNKPALTVNEIISTLKRSNIPTILIEGSDDFYIYRLLKLRLDKNIVNFQPCGGRNNLFTIYNRRSEFDGKQVIFIADKDSYRFIGVPKDKIGIIFTEGYCIENDIYDGSGIDDLIDFEDLNAFNSLKKLILAWYSFEVENLLNEPIKYSMKVDLHINQIVPVGSKIICTKLGKKINFTIPTKKIEELVDKDYGLNVRGKQIFQSISRFTSAKGRFSAFSDKNLIETAIKLKTSKHIDSLISKINMSLSL